MHEVQFATHFLHCWCSVPIWRHVVHDCLLDGCRSAPPSWHKKLADSMVSVSGFLAWLRLTGALPSVRATRCTGPRLVSILIEVLGSERPRGLVGPYEMGLSVGFIHSEGDTTSSAGICGGAVDWP